MFRLFPRSRHDTATQAGNGETPPARPPAARAEPAQQGQTLILGAPPPAALLAVLLSSGIWSQAAAQSLAEARLPQALSTPAGVLERVSCGVRDTLWMDHYVAGLYVPPGATAQAARDPRKPVAVRMEVIDARWLPEAIPQKWRRTLTEEMEREPMGRVRSAYGGLSSGDVVTFTYLPGEGVAMRVNGEVVARTPGHGVVEAILQAWAGRDPVSGKLHRLQLEHAC